MSKFSEWSDKLKHEYPVLTASIETAAVLSFALVYTDVLQQLRASGPASAEIPKMGMNLNFPFWTGICLSILVVYGAKIDKEQWLRVAGWTLRFSVQVVIAACAEYILFFHPENISSLWLREHLWVMLSTFVVVSVIWLLVYFSLIIVLELGVKFWRWNFKSSPGTR